MRSDARAKCVEISVINNNYCKLFTHLLGVLISTTKYKTRLSHRPQSSSTKCPALKSMVITNLKEKQQKYETETGCQLRRFVHVIWRQVAGSRSSRRRSRSNEFTSNSTSIRLPRSLSLSLSPLSVSPHRTLYLSIDWQMVRTSITIAQWISQTATKIHRNFQSNNFILLRG